VAPALPGNLAMNPQSLTRGAAPNSTALVSVPHLSGALAFSDAGRRNPRDPVTIALTLRYNHQDELDELVAKLNAPQSGKRHFLSAQQFNSRYAPTVSQEQAVVHALESAGFTITQRFPNRTIVDAKAPSAVVERFFSTEMHTVHERDAGHGARGYCGFDTRRLAR
jgi:subtilase family serine protease